VAAPVLTSSPANKSTKMHHNGEYGFSLLLFEWSFMAAPEWKNFTTPETGRQLLLDICRGRA
jgi:hypothetical protein